MFQTKFVENKTTHFPWFFPRKSRRLWDNLEKYGRVGQTTDYQIIRLMRCAS